MQNKEKIQNHLVESLRIIYTIKDENLLNHCLNLLQLTILHFQVLKNETCPDVNKILTDFFFIFDELNEKQMNNSPLLLQDARNFDKNLFTKSSLFTLSCFMMETGTLPSIITALLINLRQSNDNINVEEIYTEPGNLNRNILNMQLFTSHLMISSYLMLCGASIYVRETLTYQLHYNFELYENKYLDSKLGYLYVANTLHQNGNYSSRNVVLQFLLNENNFDMEFENTLHNYDSCTEIYISCVEMLLEEYIDSKKNSLDPFANNKIGMISDLTNDLFYYDNHVANYWYAYFCMDVLSDFERAFLILSRYTYDALTSKNHGRLTNYQYQYLRVKYY
ncbi:unnamed protein product [Gordionus sp. m RMFG-2023]